MNNSDNTIIKEFDENKILHYSSSFFYLHRSIKYLEDYVKNLYTNQNINELEESISKTIPKDLTDQQRSFILTETLIANRLFTLVDSYIPSICYELELLSNSYFKYQSYEVGNGMSIKPIFWTKEGDIEINRLKENGLFVKVKIDDKYKDLIDNYFQNYKEIRNPNTHNASGTSSFFFLSKLILMSISYLDVCLYHYWFDSEAIKSHMNYEAYQYFYKTTEIFVKEPFKLTMKGNISELDFKLLQTISEEEFKKYEAIYDKFFRFTGGEQFSIFFI